MPYNRRMGIKQERGYKPGTAFIYFGVMLVAFGALGQGAGLAGLMLIAGIVLVIVGIAKKTERTNPPFS